MDEPIAIIGLDARFPGEGDTAERFYESLLAGRSARTEVPNERYNADSFWHPDGDRSGSTRQRFGHFLKGSVSAFDAPFFSITPSEANNMDPAQRGMLESVYKALENAGIPLATAAGSQTGVYVGCFSYDYHDIIVKDLDIPSKYAATGTVASMLSNRVSWFFDFRGPSVTIDTACSSSLVAAHEACMSLKLREISMAIVGGCNLILTPEMTLTLDAAGVLGPDGKSYSFDHRGNGYARGEGFGTLVLKRVSDAIRDGDVIRAVIRNSSTNSDGRSPGITQPTKRAQAALIKHVYTRAGLDPSLTRFFEAHGTGTAVGDPIEASAIGEIFAPHRSPEEPLFVGALKSNVGHLEGAAGVAGLIKGVLTLESGVIPPNIWFEKRNPKILDEWNLKFPTEPTPWPKAGLRRMSINSFGVGGSNAHVVMDDALHFLQAHRLLGSHRTAPWPRTELLLPTGLASRDATVDVSNGTSNGTYTNRGHINGVHTNGIHTDGIHTNGTHTQEARTIEANGHNSSLTNGHAGGSVNGSSNEQTNGRAHDGSNGHSSRYTNGQQNGHTTENSPKEPNSSNALSHHLFVLTSFDQDGISRSREKYTQYLVSIANQPVSIGEDFLRDLSFTLGFKRTRHAWRSFGIAKSFKSLQKSFEEGPAAVRAKSDPRLAFIFTGQGAQWPAMGMELMAYPAFQQSILAADRYLNDLGCPWSLAYELSKGVSSSQIDDPEFCQPICTALQVALVDLLRTWDIHPSAITGHSSGEVAGAYAAGAISAEAAWKIAYFRGKLSAKLARSDVPTKTGMAAVGLDLEATRQAIERINSQGGQGTLEIACFNSWQSHTISGEAAQVASLVEMLTLESKFARKLNVQLAYHSQYMKAVAEEYLAAMGELQHGTQQDSHSAQSPAYYSSVSGMPVPLSRLQDPAYWVENLVSPVRFCDSATALLAGSPNVDKYTNGTTNGVIAPATAITDVLEIGPHSALKGPLVNIAKEAGKTDSVQYHSILIRNRSSVETALETAGSLFCSGYNVNLEQVNNYSTMSPKPLMLTDLPGYSFNHAKEYWLEGKPSRDFRQRPFNRHELLGAPVPDWNPDNAIWRNYIRVSENPWVEDHKVSGEILYPAAGMLVMAVEASRQIADKTRIIKGFRFRDVSFHHALRVPEDALGVESHFYLRPYRESSLPTKSSWSEFQVCTFQDGQWREHCRGLVKTEYTLEGSPPSGTLEDQLVRADCDLRLSRAREACTNKVEAEKLYRSFQDSGLDFGPTFRTVSDVRIGADNQILVRVDSSVPAITKSMAKEYLMPHLIHPATLDGIIHANIAPLVLDSKGSGQPRVPIYAKEIWIGAEPHVSHDSYLVAATPQPRGRQDLESSVTAVHPGTGEPLIHASGLTFKTLPGSPEPASSTRQGAYNIEWKVDPTFLDEGQAATAFGIPMVADDDPSKWMDDCESLCLAYIRRFLDSVANGSSSLESMDWHHKRYVSWMEHVVNHADPNKLTAYDNEAIAALEQGVATRGTPEGRLITAVGQALTEMLGGPLDPLEVVFKDHIAEDVYRDGLGAKRCYAQLCAYVDALAHKNPALEVLEIGAGTGGATRPVMETLTREGRRYQHYDFTDISPSFFEHARETFATELAQMDFRVLNVENDPLDQGFEAGKYDLVVAANVLHATKNIDVSLAHAKKLLKPGGRLLLYEITNNDILLGSFCFGVLPGWWLSEDKDRQWGPLMSVEGWRKHLADTGFSGLDGVFSDFPGSPNQMTSILVSTVPLSDTIVPEARTNTYVLADDSSQLQKDVSEGLARGLLPTDTLQVVSFADIKDKDVSDATVIVLSELDGPILEDMAEQVFSSLQTVVGKSKTLFWLSRGGSDASPAPGLELVTGLARVIRLERGDDFKFASITFPEGTDATIIVDRASQALHAVQSSDENSFRVSSGLIHVPRLVQAGYLADHIQSQTQALNAVQTPFGADPGRHLALRIGTPGQLDTLEFADDELANIPLARDEVEFQVMACGLSSRDLGSALGKIDEAPFGIEAAGVVTKVGAESSFNVGDRVFGLCPSGTLKSVARTQAAFLSKMPDSLSWIDAAAIPFAYTSAHYILYQTGNVLQGDTVLIHGAASPAGQAAIRLAQLRGVEIFITDESEEQRALLEITYKIPHDHIFTNMDRSFKLGIDKLTTGRGVDLIIDCVAGGTARDDSWDCIAPFGRLVELEASPSHNICIPRQSLQRNLRFETYDLAYRASHDPRRTQTSFKQAMETVLSTLEPLNGCTWASVVPFSQLQDAFRQLQSTNQKNFILEPHADDIVPVVPSRAPACTFDPDASYVIAGGLGGLGRSTARWMASRGAKNLILLSRSGPVTEEATNLIAELEQLGSKVAAPACDVSDVEILRASIAECLTSMPQIKGCIQGSMVLKDNRIQDMSSDEWNSAVRSKTATSWNLHSVLGQDLEFFILLSSTVGISGNPEQSNYAAAGTFQDSLARHLSSLGHPTISMDLPVILGVGFVAEKPELLEYMRSTGWAYMEEAEFHAALDYHCRPHSKEETLSQLVRSQVIPRFWLPQETAAEGYSLPSWRLDPMFSHLASRHIALSSNIVTTAVTGKDINHAALLASATSQETAEEIVLEAVLLKLSRVLSVDLSDLDAAKPLHTYGVDSLVAVDLRAWLLKHLDADVSVFDMTNHGSIYQLVSTVTGRSKLTPSFGN